MSSFARAISESDLGEGLTILQQKYRRQDQSGFVPGISCSYNLFILQQICIGEETHMVSWA